MEGTPVVVVFFSGPVDNPASDVPLIWLAEITPTVADVGANVPPDPTTIAAVVFVPLVMPLKGTLADDVEQVPSLFRYPLQDPLAHSVTISV